MSQANSDSFAQRLQDLREKIDSTDLQLIELLNERAKLAVAVGEIKSEHDQPIFRPEREMAVIEGIQNRS